MSRDTVLGPCALQNATPEITSTRLNSQRAWGIVRSDTFALDLLHQNRLGLFLLFAAVTCGVAVALLYLLRTALTGLLALQPLGVFASLCRLWLVHLNYLLCIVGALHSRDTFGIALPMYWQWYHLSRGRDNQIGVRRPGARASFHIARRLSRCRRTEGTPYREGVLNGLAQGGALPLPGSG